MPIDDSLQARPRVPSTPSFGLASQNPGDCSKYTRSLVPGAFNSGLYGFRWNPYLPRPPPLPPPRPEPDPLSLPLPPSFCWPPLSWCLFCARSLRRSRRSPPALPTITRDAPSNLSLRLSPIDRNTGSLIQQVFTVQDPDMPWHLHSCFISDWTCWNTMEISTLITLKHMRLV